MEKVLQTASDIARKDAVSKVLQELHGSIVSLSKRVEDSMTRDELNEYSSSFEKANSSKLKKDNLDECVDSLKLIYGFFLQLEQVITQKIEQREEITKRVMSDAQNGANNNGDDSVELSAASKEGGVTTELKKQMDGFYSNLLGLEGKMQENKLQLNDLPLQGSDKNYSRENTVSPNSARSGLSALQSAFDSDTMNTDAQKHQMDSFMANINKLRDSMADKQILESKQGSIFSVIQSENLGTETPGNMHMDLPNQMDSKEKPARSSSFISDLSMNTFTENQNKTMNEIIGKMYNDFHKLADLMCEDDKLQSVKLSVAYSELSSQKNLSRGSGKPPVHPSKLDFKKVKNPSFKKGLSIELEDDDPNAQKEAKQYPQSTKHAAKPNYEKQYSERDFTSNDRRKANKELDASIDDLDMEKDQIIYKGKKESAQDKSLVEDFDDASVFSGDTPKYFYELRQPGLDALKKDDVKNAPNPYENKPTNANEQVELQSVGGGTAYSSVTQSDAGLNSPTPQSEILKSGTDPSTMVPTQYNADTGMEKIPEKVNMSKAQGPKLAESWIDLPNFEHWRVQPAYTEIDPASLKFPETKKFLQNDHIKGSNITQSTLFKSMASTERFIDSDFKPIFFSVVGDVSNTENLDLKFERRLEWRRAKYIFKPKKPALWPSGSAQSEYNFISSHSRSKTVQIILEQLASQGMLNDFVVSTNFKRGEHSFAFYNQDGQRRKVTVDDFLPVSAVDGILMPVYLKPLVVGDNYYILHCLMEKALAKVYGCYVLLHRAPLASVMFTLFGCSVLSTDLQKVENCEKIIKNYNNKPCVAFLKQKCQIGGKETQQEVASAILKDGGLKIKGDSSNLSNISNISSKYSELYIANNDTQSRSENLTVLQLSPASNGASFKLSEAATISITLTVSNTHADDAHLTMVHVEVLDQNLNQKYFQCTPASDLTSIELENLQPDRYFLLLTFKTIQVTSVFTCQKPAEIKLIDEDELGRVRRAIVRRHPYTEKVEMLKELTVLAEQRDCSSVFKVNNFDKIKGKELRIRGMENWRQWIVEHNGVSVKLPIERSTLLLTGVEEEYIRIYPARPTAVPHVSQLKLVFN